MSISKALACLLAVVASLTTLIMPAHAGPVPGQGTWESTLQARHLDGDGVVDAFYDTTLDITWLRNANANGLMNWGDANDWAGNLNIGGHGGWRLPVLLTGGGYTPTSSCNVFVGALFGGINCGFNVIPATSEIATLWYTALGNNATCPPGDLTCQTGLTNTGDFIDLMAGNYWFGTDGSSNGTKWYFAAHLGDQWPSGATSSNFFAVAVHDGDLGSAHIPEPGSLLLTMTCLACLGLMRRRGSR